MLPKTGFQNFFPELETLLWLESRVIDCDWSRVILWKTWLESIWVTIFLNVTRVGSSYQNCDTSRVTELNHAITDTNFGEFLDNHKKAHFSGFLHGIYVYLYLSPTPLNEY